MMIAMSEALAAEIDKVDNLAKAERKADAWQISREQGELQAQIALAIGARRIVEVGTSYGFSGLWWLAALTATEGHLHTFDVSEKKYHASRATFEAAGVADRVTNYLGDARELLGKIEGPIDLGFIDADKPSTQDYFDTLWPLVRVGGCILTDNVNSHAEHMVPYVAGLRQRDDAHTVTIPIRTGLEWTMKLR